MPIRAGGRRIPTRPKTLDHIKRDLEKFIRQKGELRREIRAAKQALVIINDTWQKRYLT